MLVLITDIAIRAPKKYEPPSPRKIFALGKLNLRKINNIIILKNNINDQIFSKTPVVLSNRATTG